MYQLDRYAPSMVRDERAERIVGSILGLVIGDALGAPFEFRRAHDIPSPVPAFELPWKGRAPGTWTDDTAMARNLWRSLISTGGELDVDDVLRRHLAWFATGPRDIGSQTKRALREHERGARDAARVVFEGRGPEVSAGNGSVMYCPPLGVAYAERPDDLVLAAPALSAITHWDDRCRTACLAVTTTVASLVRGEDPEPAARSGLEVVAELAGGQELEHLTAVAGIERPIDGPDMGFTLFTAGVALRTAAEARAFEDGLLDVVALGGDTDTNAAVAGALLGALHGRDGLPARWVDRLAEREEIEDEADRFAARLGSRGGSGPD
jgi:ADP-ribosyl-[dinitrogen reductase] hydrolase